MTYKQTKLTSSVLSYKLPNFFVLVELILSVSQNANSIDELIAYKSVFHYKFEIVR